MNIFQSLRGERGVLINELDVYNDDMRDWTQTERVESLVTSSSTTIPLCPRFSTRLQFRRCTLLI